jgi:hypothetical protein
MRFMLELWAKLSSSKTEDAIPYLALTEYTDAIPEARKNL